VTLPLKLSHKEQSTILFVLWTKRLNANQIHSEMHQIYGNKCFTTRTVHIWCKKMVGWQKFA